ncbi:hypothetical protein CR513_37946, partial [Mucuna pruriens]
MGVKLLVIEVLQVVEDPIDQVVDDEATLRRSTRSKKSAIPSDYVVYIQESHYNTGAENYPEMFSQTTSSKELNLWYDAMEDKMDYMGSNRTHEATFEKHKARLVAKGVHSKIRNQLHKDIFSCIKEKLSSSNYGICFHFELHRIGVKTKYLNADLEEEVYMKQIEGFVFSDGENLVYKLNKFIYLKFHEVITSFEFKKNIWIIVSGNKICFLALCVYDILLAANDKSMLYETSYIIGIKIHRERSRGTLGLSQEIYINKVLERFNTKDCSPILGVIAPIVKGNRLYMMLCMLRLALRLHLLLKFWEDIKVTQVLAIGKLHRRKSTFGYIFMLAGGAISWRSAKQTLTATSTMKAKFISCYEATSHSLELWTLCTLSLYKSLKLYCDNSVAIFMAKNNHVDTKYLAIRQSVKENKETIEHISTKFMIVNPLTKGMPPKNFKDHV